MGLVWSDWLGKAEQDGELQRCTSAGRPFRDADITAGAQCNLFAD
jgi:hypothetical protein